MKATTYSTFLFMFMLAGSHIMASGHAVSGTVIDSAVATGIEFVAVSIARDSAHIVSYCVTD
jgi:hypothetical protein